MYQYYGCLYDEQKYFRGYNVDNTRSCDYNIRLNCDAIRCKK